MIVRRQVFFNSDYDNLLLYLVHSNNGSGKIPRMKAAIAGS